MTNEKAIIKPDELHPRELAAVHKFVYMANEYPKLQANEVAAMFQWSVIDLNCAIWRGIDMGFFTIEPFEYDKEESEEHNQLEKAKGGKITIHEVPDTWVFGDEVESLKRSIMYAFKRLARQQADMEENYFGNWTAGYPANDVMIAMKQLIEERKMATYEVKDIVEKELGKKAKGKGQKPETEENIYTFYTLWENLEQRWGAKQFEDENKLR